MCVYIHINSWCYSGVVVYVFNPSTLEAEAGGSLEFEANLVCRVSSRTARDLYTEKPTGTGVTGFKDYCSVFNCSAVQ